MLLRKSPSTPPRNQPPACFNGAAALLLRKSKGKSCQLNRGQQLQWGRSIAAAEIASDYTREEAATRLQWGRRHCCCGNVCPGGPANLRVYCFNGAAALLLRKWRQFACSPSTGPGFNGARSIAAAEISRTSRPWRMPRPRFNGAAALLLRKCLRPWYLSVGSTASMGPQHCCCGNVVQRHDATESHFASMGPQHCCCGNRSGAVTRREAAPASMGPQHCCCGNPTRRGLSARLSPLQWGRSIAAAEICWTASLNRCYSQLQWGRSIACCGNLPTHILLLDRTSFNGAAALLLRKCSAVRTGDIGRRASMGPQHCCCGNPVAAHGDVLYRVASMGPQHCCCGNDIILCHLFACH